MGEGRIADSNFRQQRLFLQKRVEERQDRISGLLTEEAARTDITRELQKIARYDTCAMFVIEFERPEPNDSVPEAGPGKESTAAEGKMLASFFVPQMWSQGSTMKSTWHLCAERFQEIRLSTRPD